MSKKITYLILIALIGLGVLYMYKKYKVPPSIDFSKLSLVSLDGETFNFNSLKGKKTIVCMSASWCPNCINEMNAMMKIRTTELADYEIVIIDDEPIERVIQFKERKNYPFTFLKLNTSFHDISVFSIPVSYFFNSNLELKLEEIGEIDWHDPSTREHYKKAMN